MLFDLELKLASSEFNNLPKSTFTARQRADIAKQSVSGMDAGQEPPWMGSRRLCVQYRLQAAWRFDLGDLLEATVLNYYPVKGVAPILNLRLVKVTQVQD